MPANVKILRYTPEPEQLVAAAAKLCYSTCGIDDLIEKLDEEKVQKFLDHLMSLGHESPLEHITFTFGIEGCSRSLLAQITRHRIASFSVQSQRYCNLDRTFSYITPKSIEECEETKKLFDYIMEVEHGAYTKLSNILKEKHIADGVEPKVAEKMAIEDARAVLPNACETKMIVTMNLRELLHFFELRCCSRAQLEIRELAIEMLRQCQEISPLLFKNAGPSCVRGKCKEGSMSCGNPWSKSSKER